jgi:cell division protein FtsB
MVIRSRLRAIVFPLMLYVVAGLISSYFIWTAKNGDRGLRTKLEYKREIAALRTQLDGLKTDRARWLHRVTIMRSEAVDRDLAEEQARAKLDYVDPRDVMIFESSARP